MRNIILSTGTTREIDQQVEKVLRGLGNPEPPIDLEAVYKLLELDPQYYRSAEDGVVRETISRVKVGAKLVFKDPIRIWDAIRKADLKALYIPEQRRILIDGDLHEMKKRWNGAHEVGHSLLDWHQDYTLGDDQFTLHPIYHEQIEAEANYAAGRLLFLQNRFVDEVTGSRHTLKGLQKVAQSFGNSWTSTIYRTVESLDVPAFAVIGAHPQKSREERVRHLVSSPSFQKHFPDFDETEAEAVLRSYCLWKNTGPLGNSEFTLTDVRNEEFTFVIESFGIKAREGQPGGDVLTLAQCTGKVTRVLSVPG